MAAVAKAAGFAGLLRVLDGALSTQQANWRPAIWLIAVLTLLVGSVLALAQKDLKRMLAYSSISQAGYVLVGVQAASKPGTAGALFYLFTYTFIIIGSFAVVELIQGPGEARNDLGAIRGLARRQPLLAAGHAGVPAGPGGRAVYQRVPRQVLRDLGRRPAGPVPPGDHRHAGCRGGGVLLPAGGAADVQLGSGHGGRGRGPILGAGGPEGDGALTAGSPADRLAGLAAGAGAGARAGPRPRSAASAATRTRPPRPRPAPLRPWKPPPPGPIAIPIYVGLVLAVCVAFTIFAGVSSPIITLARQATMLF